MATIILKHSTVKDKLPSSAQFGEVFVNYNNENPFLATLNNQGQYEKFLSENKTKELFYTKSQVNDIIANIESGGTIEFDDYYKKNEVDTLLQSKSDIGHTHSYTALTDLPDLSIYLTEHQSLENYYTKSEADGKFLTTHQDLSGYALKSDLDDYLTITSASTMYATKEELEEHIPTVDAYTKAETDALLAGKANSAHTHDYETLTNKPDLSNFATKGEIPDTNGFATKQELEDYQMKSGMSAYLLASEAQDTYQAKGTYVVPSDLNNYVTSGYAEETFAKKGDVPTDVYTKSETDNLLAGKASSSHTHTASEIIDLDVPKIWKGTLSEYTNLTEIDNDTLYVITDESEQFVTSGDVESMISGYTTLSEVEVLLGGFSPTGHTHVMSDITDLDIPSIEGLASEAWVGANFQPQSGMSEYSTTAHTHDYSEIENTPDLTGFATKQELTYYQPVSGMSEYSTTAHTHSYTALTDLPDLSIYLTEHQDISGLATKQELANYMPNSGMTSYLTVASAESTYQPKGTYVVPSDLNDYALKSELPSIEGLASETWVGANFQPQSGMSEYSTTAHTHSQYITQTSADSRYARVVSCTQAEYDALVQNDQVEQGVLYCITESNS